MWLVGELMIAVEKWGVVDGEVFLDAFTYSVC